MPAPTLAVSPEPIQFSPAVPGTRAVAEPAPAPRSAEEPLVEFHFQRRRRRLVGACSATETPAGTYVVPTLDAASDVMTSELKTLRRMLETQLAQLAWKDLTRRAPLHTEMLRELTEIGIEQGLAGEIVAGLPKLCEANVARRYLGATLSQRVAVTGDQWLEHGGRIALVGPTGVGKTTVLAKLAVRWVLRHGSRDLALVAGDSVRIGAQDQVRALGQLLGVPVFAMDSLEELPGVLARLGRFRMVLVDTPGAGQRDASLAQRLLQLSRVGSELQIDAGVGCEYAGRSARGSRAPLRTGPPDQLCADQGGRGRDPGRDALGADTRPPAHRLCQRRTAGSRGSAAGARRGTHCHCRAAGPDQRRGRR